MDNQNNNKNLGIQTEENDLSQKRYTARVEMESKEERNRRETEEKILRDKKAKEDAIKKAEEDKIASEEKMRKEKEEKEIREKEQSKSTSTKITKEVEKIKSVGAQINSLRTFKSDMDDMIRDQNISLARMTMQEEARRREIGEQASTSSSKNILYAILILIFLVSGGAIGWYIYVKNTTVPVEQVVVKTESFQPIIYAEIKKEFEYSPSSKAGLLAEIKNEVFTGTIEPGKIESIIIFKKDTAGIKKEATSLDIFEILNAGAPDDLKRSLLEKSNIFLIAPLISERTGGLIFRTESYQKSFAGMLNWEKGTMIRDLYELMTGVVPGDDVLDLNFIDMVINNQDARVLIDINGQPKIIYGFLNSKVIAIAGSIDSFNEMVSRFKNGGTN